MKTIYILSAILLLNFTATAQKNVVALHSGETVTFFEGHDALSTAYNASQNGDILYLSGGSFPGITINKGVSIIGVGVHPDSTEATLPTVISSDLSINSNIDGIKIEGLEILGELRRSRTTSANNVELSRIKVNGSTSLAYGGGYASSTIVNNWLIKQCIFMGAVLFSTVESSLIENNFFNKSISYTSSNTIKNNIFLESSTTGWSAFYSNNFYNNLFNHPSGVIISTASSSSNHFEKNIFASSDPVLGSGFTESGNFKGIALGDILVDFTGGDFTYDQNYRLKDAVKATYQGSDDTDIGVYGGTFPFKDGLMPAKPHIYEKKIAPTINSEGKLEVEVKVRAQN